MAGPHLPGRGRAEERLRLDQPGRPRRQLRPTYDSDAFGRVAEVIARYLGTARYLVIQTFIVIGWIAWNVGLPERLRFDPFPFIFLTLVLSLQAAYAAPLILLAQNRQDDRDRANLVEDRGQAGRNLEDTEFLARELAEVRLALGEVVTRDFLRSELRELLDDALVVAASRGDRQPGGGGAPQVSRKSKSKAKRDRERREQRPDSAAPLVSEPQRPDEQHAHQPAAPAPAPAPADGPAGGPA